MKPKTTEATTDMYILTAAERRRSRLLGDVGRRVEARDRVLGHQQTREEDVPEDDAAEGVQCSGLAAPAREVESLCEDEAEER